VLQYMGRRILTMIPTLIAISIVAFLLIQLPPGDYLAFVALGDLGENLDQEAIAALRERYGLGQPAYIQYLKWISRIVLHGDFGLSFEFGTPARDLIWRRLAFTFLLSLSTLLFTWVVAFPIGVYAAVKHYSLGDYLFTFLGFIGLSIPNFLLALVLMYVAYRYFGQSVGGLFSPEFLEVGWSWAKVLDLLGHLWIPMVILGTSRTAGLIRVMRANLLDELHQPYVVAARARGLSEFRLLLKYPLRVALNPFISTVGWVLPGLVSGSAIVSVVLSLPTTGPLLLRALRIQDMYLASSFILMLSVLTVIGTFISDILLAMIDPRIRYGRE
jgi:peptide/nickel transport system permease protein